MNNIINFAKLHITLIVLTAIMIVMAAWTYITVVLPKYMVYYELVKPMYQDEIGFWVYYVVLLMAIVGIIIRLITLYDREAV